MPTRALHNKLEFVKLYTFMQQGKNNANHEESINTAFSWEFLINKSQNTEKENW